MNCKPTLRIVSLLLLTTSLTSAKNFIQVPSPGNGNDIQPALQSAVNGASSGDEIDLPAGQFVLNKSVIITKFISIKGKGKSQTVLYRAESVADATLSNNSAWDGMFRYDINNNTTSSGIVLSDFTLKSKIPSQVTGDGLSLASDIGIKMVNCLDFVITRCRFENFGNGAVSVLHDDSIARGVICKNEFIHNVKGYDGLGLGYGVVVYGTNTRWIVNPRFGSSNFIFIEDNYFDYHRHSVAGGGGGLYVFRNNYVKNNTAANTAHAVDMHEARLTAGANYYSTRAIEVYNDTLINTQFKDGTSNTPNGTSIVPGKSVTWLTECAIRTRGGDAIVHDNYIEGYRFGVGLIANSLLSNPYPNPYQQGYLSGLKFGANHTGTDSSKGDGDVFIWANNFKLYNPSSTANTLFYNYSASYLVNHRDYHLSALPVYQTYTYPHPLRGTAISLSVSAVNATCAGSNNGKATVTASGGSVGAGAYQYSWSTNPVQTTAQATNLPPGTYTVTVTNDAGDKKTATITITAPPAIVLNTTSTPENCGSKNGSATVSVNAGSGPYTYQWSVIPAQTTPVAIGLAAGIYSVTVSDPSGCSKTVTANVPSANGPQMTGSATSNVSCKGLSDGSASITVTSGIPPYTYSWNTVPVRNTVTVNGLPAGAYEVTFTDSTGCSGSATINIAEPEQLDVNSMINHATCYGLANGSISVVPSGGVAPYSYHWNTVPAQTTGNIQQLVSGTYQLSITDYNGCLLTKNIQVESPDALVLSTTVINSSCGQNNGSIAAHVVGGTPAYTYSWSSASSQDVSLLDSIGSGTYTLTVSDANGCTGSMVASISDQNGPSVQHSNVNNVSCHGLSNGFASVTLSGGKPPYTYLWNTVPVQSSYSASELGAGTYVVTFTDSLGCAGNTTITITEPPALTALVNTSTPLCHGEHTGLAIAQITGGTAPYTYLWNVNNEHNDTLSGLAAGVYDVTVTDNNNCSANATALVGEPASNVSNIIKTDASCTNCNDGNIVIMVSGSPATYTFVWNPMVVGNTNHAGNLAIGSYTVTITSQNGCIEEVRFNIEDMHSSTGIANQDREERELNIFPNPAQSNFFLDKADFTQGSKILVVLYNAMGKEVYSKVLMHEGEAIAVDTENRLVSGVYLVIASSDDRYYRKRLVIKH